VSEERITLDMLGELILNMQGDLQVVSSTMLRLDRLSEEIREIRNELRTQAGRGP
jgi:hypothetical protein